MVGRLGWKDVSKDERIVIDTFPSGKRLDSEVKLLNFTIAVFQDWDHAIVRELKLCDRREVA